MIDLNKILDQKLNILEKSIISSKQERDSATIDSRSDQSGFIADQLLVAHSKEIKELMRTKKEITTPKKFKGRLTVNCFVTLNSSGTCFTFFSYLRVWLV